MARWIHSLSHAFNYMFMLQKTEGGGIIISKSHMKVISTVHSMRPNVLVAPERVTNY
jgi:hypothetical protein